MQEKCDYLIVGAGFAGCILAERLTSIGKKVILIDKRDHVGGNCFDFTNPKGLLVHKYGPHYFRTDSDQVKDYLSKFTEWIPAEYIVKAFVNGKLYPLPINRDTINQFFNINLQGEEEAKYFMEKKREKIENPKNAEEFALSVFGREIYEAFFKNYTKKHWGIDARDLAPSVVARIPLRHNTNNKYVNEKFQAMPKEGYTKMFEKMLKNTKVLLNTDFKKTNEIDYKRLIFTGPIDEFFDYKFGKLPYRSVKFNFIDLKQKNHQPSVQINYPNDFDFTRKVEIKHVTGQKEHDFTTVVEEFPCDEGDPFYPIPNEKNEELYKKYKEEADKLANVFFIGRMAEYKYLNIDHVAKKALELFDKIKND